MGEISNRAHRGGRNVVSERIPKGAYDKLMPQLWSLAKLLLTDEMIEPMAPSTINAYPRRLGPMALELSIDYDKSDRVTAPSRYVATLTEIEPYAPQPGAELWNWRRFEVSQPTRSVFFSRGVSIVGQRSSVYLNNEPADDEAAESAPAWERARRLADGNTDDYFWFLRNLQNMLVALRAGEI